MKKAGPPPKPALRGIRVQLRRGKIVVPKPVKPTSAETRRKEDAHELISALADAAAAIGAAGIVNDYSNYNFHLYPQHLVSLLPDEHPSCGIFLEKHLPSEARLVVPWPWRQAGDEPTQNELRENPFEIIGLLTRKVLDGDAAFFESVAETLREAKREAKQKDAKANRGGRNRVGKISADMPSYGMMGDPDWFERIVKPLRKGKVPSLIWEYCKCRHEKGQTPPTRRDISDHLEANDVKCSNLRTVLARMNLGQLEEGPRKRKA